MTNLRFPQSCISLPSGVQGVLAHAPHLTHAHVSITIAAGYLDEPPALPGLAHLLEHVLTTAPLTTSSNTSLLTWFAQRQGSLNAHTDDYVTDVHFSIPTDSLEAAALTVASQLATPTLSSPTIRTEVAAIDAEWQARQHSSAMQRLSAIATLSDPQHIGAGCRHGNAQTLGHNIELLHEALTTFHRDHYHRGGRVNIAIISPRATEAVTRLIQRMATLFNPRPPNASALAITPRWGSLPRAKLVGTAHAVELLWPLPSSVSRHQFNALSDVADSLNQGYLVDQLADSIIDYHATAAPTGATDTFSLTLIGTAAAQERLEVLADSLSERLAALLATAAIDHRTVWQPPVGTVQLASAWFVYARQQALARRLAANTAARPYFPTRDRRPTPLWLVYSAPTTFQHTDDAAQLAATPKVQSWCGQYGVSDDFTSLANTAWAACFIPNAMFLPAPLAAKQCARRGVVCQHMQLAQGSWVITVGKGAAVAMQTLLKEANVNTTITLQGLLAQRLLQRLTPLPATPAVWVSHATDADAVCHALADLASRIATRSVQTPSINESASTAIMRTLSLPGTPTQRWLLALVEQHHSAAFFKQARYDHHLGYVAAVRRGDGTPCSLGYVVQTSEDAEPVGEKLLSITHTLWKTADDVLQAPNSLKRSLTPPETPLAALIIQWQSLLSGTDQPLHRLGQQSIDSQALTDLLTQINTHGHWQTHWLDSAGHYRVND
ncbi:insulinase family protein [Halomonas campaniensis]|uniref:insulinase family protein n=1 Tax=Halomonas campaniensis TaxID=213554 RepID=UPI001F0ADDA2|nr:insulinase family protein [Halomonas campaniensis]